MAFPTSGLFVPTFLTALGAGTTIALDLDAPATAHKVALYTNSLATADLTANTSYAASPWNANEVVGTGYTAGGQALVTNTWAHTAGGVVMWDANDPAWTTATITARGALYYAAGLAGTQGICAQTFGADITSTAGTFTIQLASGGIFSIDFVP
jgi:hypothetical protein